MADCTFRPAINRHSDRLMADRSIVLRVRNALGFRPIETVAPGMLLGLQWVPLLCTQCAAAGVLPVPWVKVLQLLRDSGRQRNVQLWTTQKHRIKAHGQLYQDAGRRHVIHL